MLNHPLKNPRSSGLDHFPDLLAKDRQHICFVNPHILVEVFPDDIENLSEKAKKHEL